MYKRRYAVQTKCCCFFLTLCILCFFSHSGYGQVKIRVAKSAARKVKIAVAPFKQAPDSGGDILLARTLYSTLCHDLELSGYFVVEEMPQSEAATDAPGERITVNMAGLIRREVEWLLVPQYKVHDRALGIHVTLYEVPDGNQLLTETFRGSTNHSRATIHQAADKLVEYLAGKPGIAQTRIACVSDRDGTKTIFIMDYDGYNITRVVSHQKLALSPDWHPDGQKLVYTSYLQGMPFIYLQDLVTAAVEELSARPGLNAFAEFSPDGKYLAMTLSKDGNPELYRMALSSSRLKRLTVDSGIDTSPSWSPDGRQITFVSDRSGTPQIYVTDHNGRTVSRLTRKGGYNTSPKWSPDGKWIAFSSRTAKQFDLYMITPDGRRVHQLTDDAVLDEDPSWAPDGRHLVYSAAENYISQLKIIDIHERKPITITKDRHNYKYPSWSPYQ